MPWIPLLGEKKLAKLGAPDVHGKNPVDDKGSKGFAPKGAGATSGASGSSATHTSGGRMLNENKALSSKKNRCQPTPVPTNYNLAVFVCVYFAMTCACLS